VFIHCSPTGPEALVYAVDRAENYHRCVKGNRGLPGLPWGADTVTKFLAKIVAWITAGYPEGVPGPDRVPLFALLTPRLTDDEVKTVAKELLDRGEFDEVDIGVLITQLTDELPAPEDIERVRNRLAAKGWPLDEPRDAEETE
jgi:hypothetical protein